MAAMGGSRKRAREPQPQEAYLKTREMTKESTGEKKFHISKERERGNESAPDRNAKGVLEGKDNRARDFQRR